MRKHGGMSGNLITLHFDLCAGYMSGVHFVRIQVVYLMICVTVYILYIDKNDKLKNIPFIGRKWLILIAACLQNPIHTQWARDFLKRTNP